MATHLQKEAPIMEPSKPATPTENSYKLPCSQIGTETRNAMRRVGKVATKPAKRANNPPTTPKALPNLFVSAFLISVLSSVLVLACMKTIFLTQEDEKSLTLLLQRCE